MNPNNIEIDTRQILLTKPMIEVIRSYNPDIDLSQFKISIGEQGFRLQRMERMMLSNFDELISNEPVHVIPGKNRDGKMIGNKIDGVLKKLYEIIDGRHRVTRAIIEGRITVNIRT